MTMNEHCIIVGAGHGGVQAAASLRQEAYQGRITLVSRLGEGSTFTLFLPCNPRTR